MLGCYRLQWRGICEVCATYLRPELPFGDANQVDGGSAKGRSKDLLAGRVPGRSPHPGPGKDGGAKAPQCGLAAWHGWGQQRSSVRWTPQDRSFPLKQANPPFSKRGKGSLRASGGEEEDIIKINASWALATMIFDKLQGGGERVAPALSPSWFQSPPGLAVHYFTQLHPLSAGARSQDRHPSRRAWYSKGSSTWPPTFPTLGEKEQTGFALGHRATEDGARVSGLLGVRSILPCTFQSCKNKAVLWTRVTLSEVISMWRT